MNYVAISIEPDLKFKIIFGDQSFTLSFILNSWIFIAITTTAIILMVKSNIHLIKVFQFIIVKNLFLNLLKLEVLVLLFQLDS